MTGVNQSEVMRGAPRGGGWMPCIEYYPLCNAELLERVKPGIGMICVWHYSGCFVETRDWRWTRRSVGQLICLIHSLARQGTTVA